MKLLVIYLLVALQMNAALGNMNRERFFEILDWFYDEYSHEVKVNYGGNLLIIANWQETTPSAYAQREGRDWIIRVLGGLARSRYMTEDAFIFVLCHELGHHIGGAPKKVEYLGIRSWSSSEGQADYYANLKCMRRLLHKQNNLQAISKLSYPEIVEKKCSTSFADPQSIALCIRSSMAAFSHARFLNRTNENFDISLTLPQQLFGTPQHGPVSFDTVDPIMVRKTYHRHPSPQCRLDSAFQGALCPVSWRQPVSQDDFIKGTCTSHADYTLGLRPRCWFHELYP